MKKIIYLFLSIGMLSATFAEEPIYLKEQYNYRKFSGSIFYQNIGFGWRTHNITEQTGDDLSLNSNLLLWSIPLASTLVALPSIKYTYLMYKEPKPESQYFGIGVEGFVPIAVGAENGIKVPLPNVEVVWGKERSNHHHSQFGVNLLPIGVFIGASIQELSHPQGMFSPWITILNAGAMTLPATFSYTVSF